MNVITLLNIQAHVNNLQTSLKVVTVRWSVYDFLSPFHSNYIFDNFQNMKISNKLFNNGCNTLMQYLMTVSYQSFVPYVKT